METSRYYQRQRIKTGVRWKKKSNAHILTCAANPPASNYQAEADA